MTPAYVNQIDRLPTGRRPVAQARVEAETSIWPIVFVIYATLMPRELHFSVGDQYVFGDRFALMTCVPLIISALWRGVVKFVLPDWLILFAGFWSVLAMWHAYDLTRGLISGGAYAFDSICGYYLARISFRSLTSIRRALIICAPGFFVAGMSVMIESVTHHLFVRPAFASVFGGIYYHGGEDIATALRQNDVRLGLLRGYGPWPHPILAGLHLATLLPLYWMSGIRGWPRVLAVISAMLAFFTISSAAFATLIIGVFLISYDSLCKFWPIFNWRLFLFALLALLIVAELGTNSGVIGLIIRFGTFDAQTGYYRQLIWTYGTQTIAHHPWLGIGFEPYERPAWMVSDSVDNHWVLWGIRYGMPAALALFAACIVTIWALGRTVIVTSLAVDARFYRGLLMTLSVLVLMMFTVALQGGTLTWFTLMLGGCVACAQRGFMTNAPKNPIAHRRMGAGAANRDVQPN